MGLSNPFIAIMPARKADVTGGIALHRVRGNVTAGPGAVQEVLMGAALSPGGKAIFALPSRNRRRARIRFRRRMSSQTSSQTENTRHGGTEYGIAYLPGAVQERTQACDRYSAPGRPGRIGGAGEKGEEFLPGSDHPPQSGAPHPEEISGTQTFKDGLRVHFRRSKPSDEDEPRRLFDRLDKSVYYRYFSPIKTMPHSKMQEYVNVDYQDTMSIVGLVEDEGSEKVIAEARYAPRRRKPLRRYGIYCG